MVRPIPTLGLVLLLVLAPSGVPGSCLVLAWFPAHVSALAAGSVDQHQAEPPRKNGAVTVGANPTVATVPTVPTAAIAPVAPVAAMGPPAPLMAFHRRAIVSTSTPTHRESHTTARGSATGSGAQLDFPGAVGRHHAQFFRSSLPAGATRGVLFESLRRWEGVKHSRVHDGRCRWPHDARSRPTPLAETSRWLGVEGGHTASRRSVQQNRALRRLAAEGVATEDLDQLHDIGALRRMTARARVTAFGRGCG